jgi:diguanylate cyclase (GGDEF)-like protein
MAQRQTEPALDDTHASANIQPRRPPTDQNAPVDHQPRVRTTGQPDASRNDGSDNLAAELAQLGIKPRAAWYVTAVLYGSGGLLVALLYRIDPALFPRGLFYLGCTSVVIGTLCLLAGLVEVESLLSIEAMAHILLVTGLTIYVAGVVILGDEAVAFALMPLLTLPSPCYLYTWRFALPYVFAAASIVAVAVLLSSGPARPAHALISTFAFIMIATSMIVVRERTRRLASRNRQLAYTDPLTGLANVRSLRERISAELGRTSGGGRPFALLAMDLDDFKQVNDRFDHSLGDRVLYAVSAALNEELEPGDLAVRRGGDEFAVLVARPGERDLEELRKRLKRAIARARVATCPQVTPSGTVAYICTRPGEEIGAMMERADQALHDAKVISRERRGGEAPQLAEPVESVETRSARPTGGAEEHPERPALGAQTERVRPARRVARAVTEAIGDSNPTWQFAAVLFSLTGIAIAAVSIGHMVEPLTPAAGGAIGAGFLTLAVTGVWASRPGVSEKWLHVIWVAAYGLIALAIALAGRSGTALLDLLPEIVLYGFLLFKARTAVFYMLLGQGLYGAFAIGGGFAYGAARTAISTVAIAVVGGLVAKLRLVTVRFARRNRELSELDALTGIANMRALQDRLLYVVERASSQQLHPAVVAIDLDHFKRVNDVCSHSVGDRVLIAVARAVSECVRIDELVARRGGDEFVVVINDANPQYADAVVQRVRDAIVVTRNRICPDLQPTASVASVQWRPGETPDDFLHEADIALHAKKAESRPLPHLPATASDPGHGHDVSTARTSVLDVGPLR